MLNVSETNQAAFKQKLVLILADLKDHGSKDDQTVWLTGMLAVQLLDKAKKASWPKLKIALSEEAYNGMLASFQTQGNKLSKEGNKKATYAIQTLACSVVGSRLKDPEIASGTQLLDQFIDAAINFYRKGMAEQIITSANTNSVH